MKNKLGYFGFLGLIGVIGFFADNPGLYGFFGFFGYFVYFSVIPDELFKLNVQSAATPAFFIGIVISAVMLALSTLLDDKSLIFLGFALNFVISIIVFTVILTYRDYKERKGYK